MNPREIKLNRRVGSWSVTPYQTTHNTGRCDLGTNPRESVINKTCNLGTCLTSSRWGARGPSAECGYNPTGTVARSHTRRLTRSFLNTSKKLAPWCRSSSVKRHLKVLIVVGLFSAIALVQICPGQARAIPCWSGLPRSG